MVNESKRRAACSYHHRAAWMDQSSQARVSGYSVRRDCRHGLSVLAESRVQRVEAGAGKDAVPRSRSMWRNYGTDRTVRYLLTQRLDRDVPARRSDFGVLR